ncbi:hybrid sensor histidine kinase/response regulator [Oscillatoria salina]|uniref:hybrid sensor histidine kinase/response regulator n=1 Tax=Oscillatoria salina TaxID=331517 RepID=UPI0013B76031|nr:response regulator [Oscillatoria salina]MBZ8182162.1 response regulator [Oscillatoria salina IIICB1]NET89123.1 response regulator [Kamptonema sp. SIO1D9]
MITNTETAIILIVDDTPANLEILSDTLAEANFQVAVALDGESALEQVKYKPPDLILLDVMMPGMDGFETCTQLKADPTTREIPVIFMTALSETSNKVKGLSLGAVDYITKPFQQEEVLARVNVHLQLYNLTRTLEQKVAERTAELSLALKKLQDTQLQLVQKEKTSLLGQLVTGIAYEIKNPINFIHGNLFHAHQYVQDLLKLLQSYQQDSPQISPETESLIQEVDLDFLKKDFPKLLVSMQTGTERIQELIQAVRSFSGLEKSQVKAVDLHALIDSVLLILGSRLQGNLDRLPVEIIREYGFLPLVECYSEDISQVLLIILTHCLNAINESEIREQNLAVSVREHEPQIQPTIRIRTIQVDSRRVKLIFVHNGKQISEAEKKQLFEDFFALNYWGEKNNLGLYLSYQVITKKYRGKLDYSPLTTRGMKFILEIPTQIAEKSDR